MNESRAQVVQAYRSLYKHGLIAINYKAGARNIIRDRLRKAFRKGHISDFDPVRIRNTIQFLRGAAYNHTLEHKVLQSLIHTWRMQSYPRSEAEQLALHPKTPIEELEIRRTAYDQFNHLIRMLNESMGMCLR